jgi:hypothetical protein
MSDEISTISTENVCPKDEHDKRCAPNLSFETGSCIKLSVLIEMSKAYNIDAGEGKIKLYDNLDTLNPKKYKKYLLKEFSTRLGDKCTTQKCWTEQKFIKHMKRFAKDELEKYTFRPDGPQGKFEWLNTLHINDTMEQYEKKYPEFKFLGAVPIDFDKFERFGIKNLNYNKLIEEGKSKIGVVFNLDEHDQPGSHWVALYGDLKKGEVKFYDSYSVRPEPRIRALMRRLSNFSQTGLGIKKVDVDYNKIRHQYENSECGVYSINFITRMLKGDDFNKICESKPHDKKINKCRNIYFGNTNV